MLDPITGQWEVVYVAHSSLETPVFKTTKRKKGSEMLPSSVQRRRQVLTGLTFIDCLSLPFLLQDIDTWV